MEYFRLKLLVLTLAVILFLPVSCVNSTGKNGMGGNLSLPIERIDRLARDYVSLDSVSKSALVDSMSPGIDVLLGLIRQQGGSAVDFYSYSCSKCVEVFQPDVEMYLPNLDSVATVLGVISENVGRLVPKASFDRIFGIVTPYRQPVVVAGHIILLGLNHYLGTGYPGYESFESYLLPFKVPQRIPLDVAEAAIAVAYPYVPVDDSTVLNRLLYEGALIHAVISVVPDVTHWDVLNYDNDVADAIVKDEQMIWNVIVERGLLYSTDPMDASRLVNPSPSTVIVNSAVPGMIGRYIGYRIVESYLKNCSGATIEFLLSPDFYGNVSSFINARYSGE